MSNFRASTLWRRTSTPLLFFVSVLITVLLPAIASAQDTSHSPGWVVMPVEDYRTLHARAFPAEREPEPPPVEATLTRVDYDLRVSGELASGRASLTVDVLKDGWVRVPIPSGLLVREARLDGKLLSLVMATPGKGGDHLSAVLSHSGRSVLLLDVALPVVASTGNESISLPSTASGVTRASVQLPRLGVDMKLSGGLLSEQSESGTESKWVAYAHGNEPLTFTWRTKTEDHRLTQTLRLRGSVTQLLGLGEESTAIISEVDLEIMQGAAREAHIQLPEKITVNQVQGAMVADWEIKPGELLVTFLEPVEESAKFVITGETRLPRDGKMNIPLLRLLNSERETGGVAVEVLGAGEIKDLKAQGLENADASDLGEMVANRQSPSLAAFRFRSGDAKTVRALSVDVARYAQQAVLTANIAEARYQVLISSQGKMLVQARYAVRNNQKNFLKVILPSGAMLWSASLAGKPVRPGQASDGSLLLPLEKSRAGEDASEFAVELIYLDREPAWSDKGKARIPLPTADLPISRTGLMVFYPPLFKVTAEPGPFRTESYEDPLSAVLKPAGVVDAENEKKGFVRQGQIVDGQNASDAATASGVELRRQDFTSLMLIAPGVAADTSAIPQSLLDDFRAKSLHGRSAGILPINVSFPAFGPSIFMVSELTAENHAPAAELDYQHEKKGAAR